MRRYVSFCAAGLATALLVAAAAAQAQQSQEQQPRRASAASGSETLVELTTSAPEEVRVGQSFQYEVQVRNVSRDVMLRDVVVRQQTPDGFQIENSQLLGGDQQQGSQSQSRSRSESQSQRSGQPQPAAADAQQGQQQQGQQQQGPQTQLSTEEAERLAEQAAEQSVLVIEEQGQQDQQQGGQQNQQESDRRRAQRQQQAQQEQRQQQNQQQGRNQWRIEELAPGQTRTIQVTAVSDQEGQVSNCFTVTYVPAVCMTMNFVKPEIELAKQVPSRSDICRPLMFQYTIRNTGSGATEELVVRDELPEELRTAEGQDVVSFEVGRLEPGQSKQFEARIVASRTGEFGSRAVAVEKSQDGEPLARSSHSATRIVQADLQVAIEGPGAEYVNRPINYTIRVSNQGEVTAMGSILRLELDDGTRLISASKPRLSPQSQSRQRPDRQSEQRSRQQTESRGTAAEAQEEQSTQQRRAGQQARDPQRSERAGQDPQRGQRAQRAQRQERRAANVLDVQPMWNRENRVVSWELGDIEPGQSVLVGVTTLGNESTVLEHQVVASHVCGVDAADIETAARQLVRTEIIALPALLITVTDTPDPVKVGDEVAYTVTVANEGTAPDENVQVSVELPTELEFLEATGPSEGQVQGRRITFQPVETLQPGEKAEWEVRTRAASEGDIRFQAELTSNEFTSPTIAQEPTNLFRPGSATAKGEAGSGERARQAYRPEDQPQEAPSDQPSAERKQQQEMEQDGQSEQHAGAAADRAQQPAQPAAEAELQQDEQPPRASAEADQDSAGQNQPSAQPAAEAELQQDEQQPNASTRAEYAAEELAAYEGR